MNIGEEGTIPFGGGRDRLGRTEDRSEEEEESIV
jgi:hypothetical protein